MKKNRILYLLLAVLLIINTLFVLRYFGDKKHGNKSNPGSFIAKELNFTMEQMVAFNTLNNVHENKINGIRKVDKKLKTQLFSQLSKTNVSPEEVHTITRAIGTIVSKRDSLTFYHFKAIQSICTDSQKEKFSKIVVNAMYKRGKPRR